LASNLLELPLKKENMDKEENKYNLASH
jgi:hypothetical protein